jgi:hypothetical protein
MLFAGKLNSKLWKLRVALSTACSCCQPNNKAIFHPSSICAPGNQGGIVSLKGAKAERKVSCEKVARRVMKKVVVA